MSEITEKLEREPEVRLGADRIAKERRRQVVKGWTLEHDDLHDKGELAKAASIYADFEASQMMPNFSFGMNRAYAIEIGGWPWAAADFKPSDDPIRNLEKAGALIAAEIERLQRQEAKAPNAIAESHQTNNDHEKH